MSNILLWIIISISLLVMGYAGLILWRKRTWYPQHHVSKTNSSQLPQWKEHPVSRHPSKEEQNLAKSQEEEKIVGLTKPVGYWSNRIFQEKLPFLLAKLTQDKDGIGFWQSYVLKDRASPKETKRPSYTQDRRLRQPPQGKRGKGR